MKFLDLSRSQSVASEFSRDQTVLRPDSVVTKVLRRHLGFCWKANSSNRDQAVCLFPDLTERLRSFK